MTMTNAQEKVVKQITLNEMSGLPKDADCTEVEERRWQIHGYLFEDPRLEDVSAADLTDQSDYEISIAGWRLS